jgi:hypothetical protein
MKIKIILGQKEKHNLEFYHDRNRGEYFLTVDDTKILLAQMNFHIKKEFILTYKIGTNEFHEFKIRISLPKNFGDRTGWEYTIIIDNVEYETFIDENHNNTENILIIPGGWVPESKRKKK